MECNSATDLMMKYMDGVITDAEALKLKAHIDACPSCHEDFEIYDDMLTGFANLEIIEAPEGFEEAVMAKVEAIGSKNIIASRIDNVFTAVWAILSIITGIGVASVFYRDAIAEALVSIGLGSYVEALEPLTGLIARFADNIIVTAQSFVTSLTGALADFRFIALGIFAVLLVVQIVITRRSAAKTEHSEE